MLYAPVEWHDCSEGFEEFVMKNPPTVSQKSPLIVRRSQCLPSSDGKRDDPGTGRCAYDDNIGVIILTGAGDKAFCSVVTRKCVAITAAIKMIPAYTSERAGLPASDPYLSETGCRMVAGYSIGGGHVLHMMCDLTSRQIMPSSVRLARKSVPSTGLGRFLHGSHRRTEKSA